MLFCIVAKRKPQGATKGEKEKEEEEAKEQLTIRDEMFNGNVRKIRTRIERVFADLKNMCKSFNHSF